MWLVLVLASLLLLGALGWRLWQRVRALLREVGEASRRATAAQTDAGAAFDEWLVTRADEDAAFLASLDPPADPLGAAGRTMTATDPKGN